MPSAVSELVNNIFNQYVKETLQTLAIIADVKGKILGIKANITNLPRLQAYLINRYMSELFVKDCQIKWRELLNTSLKSESLPDAVKVKLSDPIVIDALSSMNNATDGMSKNSKKGTLWARLKLFKTCTSFDLTTSSPLNTPEHNVLQLISSPLQSHPHDEGLSSPPIKILLSPTSSGHRSKLSSSSPTSASTDAGDDLNCTRSSNSPVAIFILEMTNNNLNHQHQQYSSSTTTNTTNNNNNTSSQHHPLHQHPPLLPLPSHAHHSSSSSLHHRNVNNNNSGRESIVITNKNHVNNNNNTTSGSSSSNLAHVVDNYLLSKSSVGSPQLLTSSSSTTASKFTSSNNEKQMERMKKRVAAQLQSFISEGISRDLATSAAGGGSDDHLHHHHAISPSSSASHGGRNSSPSQGAYHLHNHHHRGAGEATNYDVSSQNDTTNTSALKYLSPLNCITTSTPITTTTTTSSSKNSPTNAMIVGSTVVSSGGGGGGGGCASSSSSCDTNCVISPQLFGNTFWRVLEALYGGTQIHVTFRNDINKATRWLHIPLLLSPSALAAAAATTTTATSTSMEIDNYSINHKHNYNLTHCFDGDNIWNRIRECIVCVTDVPNLVTISTRMLYHQVHSIDPCGASFLPGFQQLIESKNSSNSGGGNNKLTTYFCWEDHILAKDKHLWECHLKELLNMDNKSTSKTSPTQGPKFQFSKPYRVSLFSSSSGKSGNTKAALATTTSSGTSTSSTSIKAYNGYYYVATCTVRMPLTDAVINSLKPATKIYFSDPPACLLHYHNVLIPCEEESDLLCSVEEGFNRALNHLISNVGNVTTTATTTTTAAATGLMSMSSNINSRTGSGSAVVGGGGIISSNSTGVVVTVDKSHLVSPSSSSVSDIITSATTRTANAIGTTMTATVGGKLTQRKMEQFHHKGPSGNKMLKFDKKATDDNNAAATTTTTGSATVAHPSHIISTVRQSLSDATCRQICNLYHNFAHTQSKPTHQPIQVVKKEDLVKGVHNLLLKDNYGAEKIRQTAAAVYKGGAAAAGGNKLQQQQQLQNFDCDKTVSSNSLVSVRSPEEGPGLSPIQQQQQTLAATFSRHSSSSRIVNEMKVSRDTTLNQLLSGELVEMSSVTTTTTSAAGHCMPSTSRICNSVTSSSCGGGGTGNTDLSSIGNNLYSLLKGDLVSQSSSSLVDFDIVGGAGAGGSSKALTTTAASGGATSATAAAAINKISMTSNNNGGTPDSSSSFTPIDRAMANRLDLYRSRHDGHSHHSSHSHGGGGGTVVHHQYNQQQGQGIVHSMSELESLVHEVNSKNNQMKQQQHHHPESSLSLNGISPMDDGCSDTSESHNLTDRALKIPLQCMVNVTLNRPTAEHHHVAGHDVFPTTTTTTSAATAAPSTTGTTTFHHQQHRKRVHNNMNDMKSVIQMKRNCVDNLSVKGDSVLTLLLTKNISEPIIANISSTTSNNTTTSTTPTLASTIVTTPTATTPSSYIINNVITTSQLLQQQQQQHFLGQKSTSSSSSLLSPTQSVESFKKYLCEEATLYEQREQQQRKTSTQLLESFQKTTPSSTASAAVISREMIQQFNRDKQLSPGALKRIGAPLDIGQSFLVRQLSSEKERLLERQKRQTFHSTSSRLGNVPIPGSAGGGGSTGSALATTTTAASTTTIGGTNCGISSEYGPLSSASTAPMLGEETSCTSLPSTTNEIFPTSNFDSELHRDDPLGNLTRRLREKAPNVTVVPPPKDDFSSSPNLYNNLDDLDIDSILDDMDLPILPMSLSSTMGTTGTVVSASSTSTVQNLFSPINLPMAGQHISPVIDISINRPPNVTLGAGSYGIRSSLNNYQPTSASLLPSPLSAGIGGGSVSSFSHHQQQHVTTGAGGGVGMMELSSRANMRPNPSVTVLHHHQQQQQQQQQISIDNNNATGIQASNNSSFVKQELRHLVVQRSHQNVQPTISTSSINRTLNDNHLPPTTLSLISIPMSTSPLTTPTTVLYSHGAAASSTTTATVPAATASAYLPPHANVGGIRIIHTHPLSSSSTSSSSVINNNSSQRLLKSTPHHQQAVASSLASSTQQQSQMHLHPPPPHHPHHPLSHPHQPQQQQQQHQPQSQPSSSSSHSGDIATPSSILSHRLLMSTQHPTTGNNNTLSNSPGLHLPNNNNNNNNSQSSRNSQLYLSSSMTPTQTVVSCNTNNGGNTSSTLYSEQQQQQQRHHHYPAGAASTSIHGNSLSAPPTQSHVINNISGQQRQQQQLVNSSSSAAHNPSPNQHHYSLSSSVSLSSTTQSAAAAATAVSMATSASLQPSVPLQHLPTASSLLSQGQQQQRLSRHPPPPPLSNTMPCVRNLPSQSLSPNNNKPPSHLHPPPHPHPHHQQHQHSPSTFLMSTTAVTSNNNSNNSGHLLESLVNNNNNSWSTTATTTTTSGDYQQQQQTRPRFQQQQQTPGISSRITNATHQASLRPHHPSHPHSLPLPHQHPLQQHQQAAALPVSTLSTKPLGKSLSSESLESLPDHISSFVLEYLNSPGVPPTTQPPSQSSSSHPSRSLQQQHHNAQQPKTGIEDRIGTGGGTVNIDAGLCTPPSGGVGGLGLSPSTEPETSIQRSSRPTSVLFSTSNHHQQQHHPHHHNQGNFTRLTMMDSGSNHPPPHHHLHSAASSSTAAPAAAVSAAGTSSGDVDSTSGSGGSGTGGGGGGRSSLLEDLLNY